MGYSSGNTDPYFSNVTVLMHMDGTEGSTAFTDVKGHAFSVRDSGSKLTTTQKKFGTASLNGSISTTQVSDLSFGTGDFTIECWAYLSSYTNFSGVFGVSTSSSLGSFYARGSTANPQVYFYCSAGQVRHQTTLATGTWYHLAVVRESGTVWVYVNGVKSTASLALGDFPVSVFTIGNSVGTGGLSEPMAGNIDEFRVTKGVARYTVNFTPPSVAFPDS